ncbi:MAG TPA: hypothetical protein VGN88_10320 [Phycisphaerae bacterium]|jgi:lipid-binding SYLF domain-containing protein
MKKQLPALFASLMTAALLAACGTTPNPGTTDDRINTHDQATGALSQFEQTDATLQSKLDNAYAYAIFPEVVTAAVGVGGAHGNGEVYQHGQLIGYADMSQANVGVQLGAQKYAELILFENDARLSDFQHSTIEFDARATAVAASSGAAATANYSNGVIVFSMPQSGLMFQAAVGGQKFRYTPVNP